MMSPQTISPIPAAVWAQELPPEPAQTPAGAASRPQAGRSLLDLVLDAAPGEAPAASRLDRFLQETDPVTALRDWLGSLPPLSGPALKQHIARRLNQDVARLDGLLNRQVNAILHHPDFQKLEASWRNLHFLVEQAPEGGRVKIRVLNISWRELTRDLTVRALEFDQSQLFRKVYSEEFGMPGGEPFGVLLGDYEIRHRMSADYPYNDVETLGAIAGVAAAAFAPFIAAAHPSLLELTSFADLERPLNLARTFDHNRLDYLKWHALRKREDARFIGLTLPRVLGRLPYVDDSARTDGFRFREELTQRSDYLWGNAAYAFGAVLVRSFAESSWLADIRGARRGEFSGGLVAGLPVHTFRTEGHGVALKCSTDTIITDAQERELSMLGFIPLCYCQDTNVSAFYSNQSIQEPQTFDKATATASAQLSAMLQYILCASRFAHYLKVIVRDRIGSYTGSAEVQERLRRWLAAYTLANDNAGPELKARHPLREAKVEVEELAGRPGSYNCRIFLKPHYQLDQIASVLKLESVLAPSKQR